MSVDIRKDDKIIFNETVLLRSGIVDRGTHGKIIGVFDHTMAIDPIDVDIGKYVIVQKNAPYIEKETELEKSVKEVRENDCDNGD